MLLLAAIAVLGVVVAVGVWLARGYLLTDAPPHGLHWTGIAHAVGGVAGFTMLVAALQGPVTARAARMGAASFGMVSGALIAGALLAGLAILLTHLRHRPVSAGLVAAHGMLGVSGYTLLTVYLTMR